MEPISGSRGECPVPRTAFHARRALFWRPRVGFPRLQPALRRPLLRPGPAGAPLLVFPAVPVRILVPWRDARLLNPNDEVAESDGAGLADLVAHLVDTCHAAPGIGLAAPQIGVNRRVA